MYVRPNFKTKKQFREALASGARIECFQPGGIFEGPQTGTITIEGPHYPEPHRWYARAKIENGLVVKIIK